MKRTREPGEILGGVNIVPVIDVSLILLIILMVTNPFLAMPNLEVQLPKAHTIEASERNITITISKDGQLAVNTEIIPLSMLSETLSRKIGSQKDTLVIVRADETLSYGLVQQVMDIAVKYVQAKNIALGTEQVNNVK